MNVPKQPKVLIVGYAKSGTTMLYSRIKNALPPDAGAFFEPLDALSVLADMAKDKPATAKVLLPLALENGVFTAINSAFNKKLLIIRDPRDILISNLLYMGGFEVLWNKPEQRIRAALELLTAKERAPDVVSALQLFEVLAETALPDLLRMIVDTQEMLLRFLAQHPDFFSVRYEDLLNGNPPELEEYLGLRLETDTVVDAAYQRVVRTKQSGSWRDWLTREDVVRLRPMMQDFLRYFSYDLEDWTLRTAAHIPPKHASEYVKKILNERRRFESLPEIQ